MNNKTYFSYYERKNLNINKNTNKARKIKNNFKFCDSRMRYVEDKQIIAKSLGFDFVSQAWITLYKSGKQPDSIAELFEVEQNTVKRLLVLFIDLRKKPKTTKETKWVNYNFQIKLARQLGHTTILSAYKDLYQQGYTLLKIANMFGISDTAVRTRLVNKIKFRKQGGANNPNGRKLICEDCGKISIDAIRIPCPYERNINNNFDLHLLCNNCFKIRLQKYNDYNKGINNG